MTHKYEIENLTNKELLYVLKVNGCCQESIDWVKKTGADLKKAWAEFPYTKTFCKANQLFWFCKYCVEMENEIESKALRRVAANTYFSIAMDIKCLSAFHKTFKIV